MPMWLACTSLKHSYSLWACRWRSKKASWLNNCSFSVRALTVYFWLGDTHYVCFGRVPLYFWCYHFRENISSVAICCSGCVFKMYGRWLKFEIGNICTVISWHTFESFLSKKNFVCNSEHTVCEHIGFSTWPETILKKWYNITYLFHPVYQSILH